MTAQAAGHGAMRAGSLRGRGRSRTKSSSLIQPGARCSKRRWCGRARLTIRTCGRASWMPDRHRLPRRLPKIPTGSSLRRSTSKRWQRGRRSSRVAPRSSTAGCDNPTVRPSGLLLHQEEAARQPRGALLGGLRAIPRLLRRPASRAGTKARDGGRKPLPTGHGGCTNRPDVQRMPARAFFRESLAGRLAARFARNPRRDEG
jgi:hypothetical protein